MRRIALVGLTLVGLGMGGLAGAAEAAAPGAADAAAGARAGELAEKGIAFLRKAQQADGAFSPQTGPAVTALVATGLLENGRSPDDPTVAKALTYLLKFVQPDGGIYQEGSTHKNYESCLAIQALKAANKDGRFAGQLAAAEKFLRGLQDSDGGTDPSDDKYGGFGYGGSKRPDLSNTAFAAETLHVLGAEADDEAMKRLLAFVSKCQNLETEHNTTKYAALNPDGGFYYTIAAGGSSQAGALPNGGLRSYGSMTYAGLKSMIYAGVDRDDPRVKAAVAWLAKHYSFDENPGMGQQGLFYYYQTLAKSLAAFGQDEFADEKGAKHDWKADLVAALAKRQHADGSWFNENDRWLEGDPNLVTGYALLALARCK